MKKIMSNLIDFFGKRTNAPPYVQNLKILLLSHEKVYDGVICLKLKKINQKKLKKIKKSKIMKRTLFIVLIMMMMQSGFSQQATINGSNCSSAPNCFEYVCEGQNIVLVSGITSGVIDNVVWRQRYSDDLVNWSSWSIISSDLTIQAPFGGVAIEGRTYQYWLRVYQGVNEYWTFFELRTNPAPISDINSDHTEICFGEIVTFNASAGGTTYDFKVNGVSQYSGPNSSWSSSSLLNNDQITVTISTGGCSATSSPISMTVRSRPDAASVTPSSTCLGEGMNWTYSGLTGTGPWVVSFWDPTHTTQYGPDYNVSNPNGSINDVPIPYGTPNVHFKIEDQYCPNF